MSISEWQCNELRRVADKLGSKEEVSVPFVRVLVIPIMREAADTIEALSAKLKDGKGAGIKTCHIEGYDDGIDENYDGDLYSYGPPTWFLSCGHQGEGIDAPDFCPVCGAAVVDSETNWEKLFGTPERAARTLVDSCNDDYDYGCGGCPVARVNCKCGDYDVLLEWLRGDA